MRSPYRRERSGLASCLATAGLALGLFNWAACAKNPPQTTEVPNIATPAKIETIALSPITDYYEAAGTVRSRTTSILSSRITGTVLAVRVREGDRVRVGQVLVEIDNRDTRAGVSRAEAASREAKDALEESARAIDAAESARVAAEASRALASSTLNRYKVLLDRKSVSQQEFDEVQARYRTASAEAERASALLGTLHARRNQIKARIDQTAAELEDARVSLSYSRITSPIDAIVTARQIDVGATASPGVPLITVEDASSYRLEAAVEDSQIGKFHEGDAVGTIIDALGTDEITGRISQIVPASDPGTHTYTVKIDLLVPRGDGEHYVGLRSGLFGRARFKLDEREALLVPTAAVVHQGQLTGIYVVDASGASHLRLIKCGKQYRDSIEVLAGLNEGERFVADRTGDISARVGEE